MTAVWYLRSCCMWKFPLYIFSTGSFLNVHMSWHDSSHDLVSLLRSPNILAKQTRKDYEQNGSTFDELVLFFKFNIYTSMIHEVPNSKVQLGSTLWCPLCKQTCWLICLISWCRWWLFLGSTTLQLRVPGIQAAAKWTRAFNQGWFLVQSILQKMSGQGVRTRPRMVLLAMAQMIDMIPSFWVRFITFLFAWRPFL